MNHLIICHLQIIIKMLHKNTIFDELKINLNINESRPILWGHFK